MNLHPIIFQGKDGASTYDVWELKVKSIINGIKRHAEWDGDNAQHRTLELKNLQKTTKNIGTYNDICCIKKKRSRT